MLTRRVVFVLRSRTNTSTHPFESPLTRLLAKDSKATYRPLAETTGSELARLPSWPLEFLLTR